MKYSKTLLARHKIFWEAIYHTYQSKPVWKVSIEVLDFSDFK